MNGDLDTLAVERAAPFGYVLKDTGDTVGVRLAKYKTRHQDRNPHRVSPISRILAASIAKEILAAPTSAAKASIWASETFGSQYQDASAILWQEERARQQHRAALLFKKHFGSLSPREVEQLETLQAESADLLAIEMKPAIAHVRNLLKG